MSIKYVLIQYLFYNEHRRVFRVYTQSLIAEKSVLVQAMV